MSCSCGTHSKDGWHLLVLTSRRRREARRPKVKRLAELLQQRRDLQHKLNHCFDTLGQAWIATQKQVHQAVKDREELSDGADDQDT